MRSVIDIKDLTAKEIDDLCKTACDIIKHPKWYAHACEGKKLATLFFEPSTRTRLSFTAAMMELGGNVLGFSEASSSSTAKGESVADTCKVVSNFADIIAMRHPKDGAALAGAIAANIPLINAGDGMHCHPTQTLADLLTIYREKGGFNNLTIGMCGDLKYGRTVHSLTMAMSRYKNIKLVLISPKELRMPDYVINDIIKKNHMKYKEVTNLEDNIKDLDILYMTRIQRERFFDQKQYERLKNSYVLTVNKLKKAKKGLRILHPLPRVNEISVKVDDDYRAAYFRQTLNGKYIRMALILKLLELAKKNPKKEPLYDKKKVRYDLKCKNVRCISSVEQEHEHKFIPTSKKGEYKCIYCEQTVKSSK
ncbi:MAG: aspartate carbamoyltransferase [Bacilli bacterium]|nr:aspartate carbamoyltransferase [Bacilli bacterium]